MKELPDVIQNFLQTLRDESHAPAYLLVNDSNVLIDWGGDLAAYGITDLQKGNDIGEQVSFLAELPPFDKDVLCLPCIQTADSYVDVYLFLRQQEIWVLLLDVTRAALEEQRLQQRANNLALEVAALKREKESLLKIITELKQSNT